MYHIYLTWDLIRTVRSKIHGSHAINEPLRPLRPPIQDRRFRLHDETVCPGFNHIHPSPDPRPAPVSHTHGWPGGGTTVSQGRCSSFICFLVFFREVFYNYVFFGLNSRMNPYLGVITVGTEITRLCVIYVGAKTLRITLRWRLRGRGLTPWALAPTPFSYAEQSPPACVCIY